MTAAAVAWGMAVNLFLGGATGVCLSVSRVSAALGSFHAADPAL